MKDCFFDYLYSKKILNNSSISAYMGDISKFLKFCNGKVDLVRSSDILDFISSCHIRAFYSVRIFFAFLKESGHVTIDPTEKLKFKRKPNKLVDILDVESIRKMLVLKNNSLDGYRNRAMIAFLYFTGIRVSELCQLNIEDIGDNLVIVKGKGNRERCVPFGDDLLVFVDQYLALRNDPCPALFLYKEKRINRYLAWRVVKYMAKSANVGNVHPHVFRHSYATHMVENSCDLRVLQDILGHMSINTTDRYTHMSVRSLKQNFEKFHPRG